MEIWDQKYVPRFGGERSGSYFSGKDSRREGGNEFAAVPPLWKTFLVTWHGSENSLSPHLSMGRLRFSGS